MATNVLAGIVGNRKATIYYLATALGASTTTTVHPRTAASATDLKTTAEMLGRNATGKKIPSFFCKKDSGSSANWAVKVQHADPVQGVAEASWDWEDLVSFAALNTDAATYETVEPTKPIRRMLRMVATRTAGTVTGLRVGYSYAQVGQRASFGSSVFAGSLG